jgi:hypothetical protein
LCLRAAEITGTWHGRPRQVRQRLQTAIDWLTRRPRARPASERRPQY